MKTKDIMNLSRRAAAVTSAAIAAMALSAASPVPDLAPAPASDIVPVQYYEVGDGGARINMSGKLRMLSQRIPGAVCYQSAGIELDKSGPLVQAAKTEYDKIIAALEFGDEDLKIFGTEDRRKTVVRIRDVLDLWEPFSVIAEEASGSGVDDAELSQMAADSGPLLRNAALLVSEIVSQYYDPVVTIASEAMTIDIAGRQRMLSQRMSKNICLINSGINVDAARSELEGAMNLFDASLNALLTGFPSAGVSEPPNQDVADGLQVVVADWEVMSDLAERTLAGEMFDDATLAQSFNGFNQMTGNMNTVVGMYADASNLGRSS